MKFEQMISFLSSLSYYKKEMSIIWEDKGAIVTSKGCSITDIEVEPNSYFAFKLGGIDYTIFNGSVIRLKKSPRGAVITVRQKVNNMSIFIKD
jgi:hypothetical protein